MTATLFGGALVTGLLGSGHCIGMCGSIVAALSLSGGQRGGPRFQLLYNLGRIGTYVFLGYLVGWLGLAVAYTDGYRDVGGYLLVAADVFVVVIGLGSAGAFRRWNVMRLEFAPPARVLGGAVGFLRRLPAGLSALPLGALLGLIPCGFLYAVLINAALTADPLRGAGIMLGFGLGTAPALFLSGAAARLLSSGARSWMMRGAGLAVALMGGYNLWNHVWGPGCCF